METYSTDQRLEHYVEWLEFDVEHKIGECWLCNRTDIVQHQNTCLNCMIRWSEVNKEIARKYKNCCSMCGQKRKLVLDSNCCNKCLNLAIPSV